MIAAKNAGNEHQQQNNLPKGSGGCLHGIVQDQSSSKESSMITPCERIMRLS
jgi:hypothetical protein